MKMLHLFFVMRLMPLASEHLCSIGAFSNTKASNSARLISAVMVEPRL
jgi:hypothetical protein